MRRARLLALLCCARVGACNGDSASPLGEARIIIGFTPGGTFTARINGKTFSSAGGFPVTLTSLGNEYEISGSFTGGSLGLTFAASTSTGVQSGSLVSVEGPNPRILNCDVMYLASTNASQQFRLRFKSTATAALVCT